MSTPQPRASSERYALWLLLLAALAASALLLHRAKPPVKAAEREFDIVSVVPAGPELLITANVGALGPVLAGELASAGGQALLGLRELCGFEPILALKQVALAMPSRVDGSPGAADFALVAQTSLEAEPVLRCAEAVIRKRGGQPVRSTLGRFRSVRDQGKPVGEVAIRDDGLFVLSGGQYFRDVVDAANGSAFGDEAARLRTRIHAGIRRRLVSSQLVVTALPGAGWPLPGVQALGLGLDVERAVEVRGFVGCASAVACSEVRQVIERMKDDMAHEPGLAGLASWRVTPRESELDVTGKLPREQLNLLMVQLFSL